MMEFDHEIGLERLAVIHANDSKMPLGGERDRHENIGEGHIGLEGFRTILGAEELRGLSLRLEVPGLPDEHGKGNGPDAGERAATETATESGGKRGRGCVADQAWAVRGGPAYEARTVRGCPAIAQELVLPVEDLDEQVV